MLNHNFTDTSHPETYIPASGARQAEQEQSDAIDANTADIATLKDTSDPVWVSGSELDFSDGKTPKIEVHQGTTVRRDLLVNLPRNGICEILYKQDPNGQHPYILAKEGFGDDSPFSAADYPVSVDPAANAYTNIFLITRSGLVTSVTSSYMAIGGLPRVVSASPSDELSIEAGKSKIITVLLENAITARFENATTGAMVGKGTKYVVKTQNNSTDQNQVINIIPIGANGIEGNAFSVAVEVGIPYGVIIVASPSSQTIPATSSVTIIPNLQALPNDNIAYQLYSRVVGDDSDGTPIEGQTAAPFVFTPVNTMQYRYSASNGVNVGETQDKIAFSSWFTITLQKESWAAGVKPTLGTITSAGSQVTVNISAFPAGVTFAKCAYKQSGDTVYTPITSNPFTFTARANIAIGGLEVVVAETPAKNASEAATNPAIIIITTTTNVLFTEAADDSIMGIGTNTIIGTAAGKGAKTATILPVNAVVLATNTLSATGASGFLCLQETSDLPTNLNEVEYGLYIYTGDGNTNLLSVCNLGDTSKPTTQVVPYNKLFGWRRTTTHIVPVYSIDNGVTVIDAAGSSSFAVESSIELTIIGYIFAPNTKVSGVKITQ